MRLRLVLTLLWLGLAVPTARAQIALPQNLLPSRPALDRLGLEKHWSAVAPLGGRTERLIQISLAEDLLFVQTDEANFHVYDAESGRYLWGVDLGRASFVALPAAVNSDQVFVTNAKTLFCLHRGTGREMWKTELQDFPSAPTAADEETAVVGLVNGMLSAFSTRDHSQDKPTPGYSAATNLFNWKSNKRISGRPIPANRVIAFGSQDGKAYVAQIQPPLLLSRFLTGGPIVASMGAFGTRTLLVPSTDNNLYATDLYTADLQWVFSSGAPIEQEPLVSNNEVLVLNKAGEVYSVNPQSGEANWSRRTFESKILALGSDRLYLTSADRDLMVLDRQSGRVVFDPRGTHERAGLNLRPYSLSLTNRSNDRLYFATPSGVIVCIREAGKTAPTPLRDLSKEQAFGYLPDPPSDSETAPAPPANAPETAPVEGGFAP